MAGAVIGAFIAPFATGANPLPPPHELLLKDCELLYVAESLLLTTARFYWLELLAAPPAAAAPLTLQALPLAMAAYYS